MMPFRTQARAAFDAVRARPCSWGAIACAAVALYYTGLVAAVSLRFAHAPNYVRGYAPLEAWRQILAGTPALGDAVPIMLAEPWFELGYLSPEWGIAEWSLMILPVPLAIVMLAATLLATWLLLARRAPRGACALAAGTGAGLAALANATLFWVVCCASPTWIVALSMLGLGTTAALALEPLGHVLNAAGLALLAAAILAQARAPARASASVTNRHAPPWPVSAC